VILQQPRHLLLTADELLILRSELLRDTLFFSDLRRQLSRLITQLHLSHDIATERLECIHLR